MLASLTRRSRSLHRTIRLLSTRLSLPDMDIVQGEESVGIQMYTSHELAGFAGILKQRYSDFIVREIDVSGNVAYLNELNAHSVEDSVFQKNEAAGEEGGGGGHGSADTAVALMEKMSSLVELSEQERSALDSFLAACLSRDEACPNQLVAFACSVKETRTAAHMAIKTLAPSFVDSDTAMVDGVQHLRLIAKHKQQRGKKRRRDQWPSGVGDFLKFKILKENIDTMSAANYMASTLNCKKDFLKFAGTKDKRAVTVQWATAYRLHPIALHRFNCFRFPPTIRCGDFEYVKEPLQLGNLRGNRFEIVLREVSCEAGLVESSCRALAERGFINYYGLQRFGKGGAGNHLIGRALLQCDWKAANDLMFAPKAGERDEVVAMKRFYTNGDYSKALGAIPSFSYYSERYCLQGLVSNPNDHYGAFQRIPRNTKFICGHAFQSYIWNMAASERVRRLGLDVAVGDLVFLSPDKELEEVDLEHEQDHEQGQGQGQQGHDQGLASIVCVAGEDINECVHVVTAEDVEADRFCSTDVVLPLLGFNSLLPRNEVGAYIQSMLDDNEITLELFRKHPFFQFSGSYRRVFSRPGSFEWSTVAYSDRNTDLLTTELENFQVKAKAERKSKGEEASSSKEVAAGEVVTETDCSEPPPPPQYLAAVLKFSLPAGAYATMLLREVMKTSTESGYHSGLTACSMQSSADSTLAALAGTAVAMSSEEA